RFLNDFPQLGTRQMMTCQRCVDHSSDRYRSGLTFHTRFCEVPFSDQVGQPLQKFAQINRRTMKVQKPLSKEGDGNNATKQNEPHQRPSLLHVVNHPKLIDELWSGCNNEGQSEVLGQMRAYLTGCLPGPGKSWVFSFLNL